MFQIDLKSRKPIYEQVSDNFKRLIMTGVLAADEKAPSVRDLSKALTVNPNTVQKAYRELENQGFIYTVPGQGSFIAAPPEAGNEKKVDTLYRELTTTVLALHFYGETETAITQAVKRSLAHAQLAGAADNPSVE